MQLICQIISRTSFLHAIPHLIYSTDMYIGGDDGDGDNDDDENNDDDGDEEEKEEVVEEASKESGSIKGPTGSGKTSLIDRLLGSVCAWIL